ncbi:MAG: transcription-repair coupling factor [Sphingomonadaceae bacterium]|uniref:transcription-repair coupling factor n=1 Tax=Thermaurantiacus sp. TaxID=2820283 RepID=UPI00298F24E9|nr:transcription-repair coupling factor [Thermaurantiacus sp.]MCS6986172.1 transcription-repair coupling factor [Sphingomonadaceae bacterium]MDW8414602.1 transcription-repair coupling factor [Thermaurantiacus sp.]
MIDPSRLFSARTPLVLGGLPAGLLPWFLADCARAAVVAGGRVWWIAADEPSARATAAAAPVFAPELVVRVLPAWDCLPFDRASPAAAVMAERLATLAALLAPPKAPELVVTTASAALQRLLPRSVIADHVLILRVGDRTSPEALAERLARLGLSRVDTVIEGGEFARRGGLIDVRPAGEPVVLRVDFLGDEVEAIREVDPETQRTIGRRGEVRLQPASELLLDPGRIRAFRQGYLERFGAEAAGDPVYQGVSEGRRAAGAEHFLPLVEPGLVSLFDWRGPADLVLADRQAGAAVAARLEAIHEHHRARLEALTEGARRAGSAPVRPLPPEALYLSAEEWARWGSEVPLHVTSALPDPDLDHGGRVAPDFAADRTAAEAAGTTPYRAIAARIEAALRSGHRVVLAAYSEGSRERLMTLLGEAGVPGLVAAAGWQEALGAAAQAQVPVLLLPLEHGFRQHRPEGVLELWTEADLLGERIVARRRRARSAAAFLADLKVMAPGELVVHEDHGIGRFVGLVTVEAGGGRHDTAAIEYAGGDRLYVPVENLDVLSRYGAETEGVALDRLGGTAWAQRKARMKERIRAIAHDLLKVAARRAIRPADALVADPTAYAAFVDRFPWVETDDQLRATAEVLEDLASGRPMDRLVCGDVGFGKTEVALRAAFVAAMAGVQVAVVCPTTLLARQHAQTFCERFRGFPVKVAQLSRLVPAAEARRVRAGLADGSIDIVVGTHALLQKGVQFRRLGLVIVDEEQHFGVAQKERLKALRHETHVLTLTATPIPRTLQMALSGLRDLSVIATPPVDRLAVRTTVGPFDPLAVREALLREHYRGGQSFLVVPRIADLPAMEEFLRSKVPELRFTVAHGQMAAAELEERMTGFLDGRFDVLLSTAIVESGLDIPNANTLVVVRADLFGLAQLYQLRGRVGRSKRRAFALLTTPADGSLAPAAEKRLQVLAGLESLGAGFELASHDLDQRGAGNLLGDEQSGHIREVGFELYQSMLEEAIVAARAEADGLSPPQDPLSPTIVMDAPVLIPETWIPDLAVRMGLYRRAAELADATALEAFAAELVDRFGRLPPETRNLLKVVEAKIAARQAGLARVEAGPKGVLVTFGPQGFPAPDRLVAWLEAQKGAARLRPDQRLFVARALGSPEQRLAGAVSIARTLARLVAGASPQALAAPAAAPAAAVAAGASARPPAASPPARPHRTGTVRARR